MEKTLIIDGHNYLYRSYYGIPSSAKLPNGKQVNAYYGFLSLLRKTCLHVKPNNLIVIFDSETGINSKLKENINYKQNRKYIDTEMFKQLPIIKQALEYIDITYMEHPKYEADDVIGSIVKKESKNGKVYISSQDKDFFQLINMNNYVLRTEKGKIVEYDKEFFKKKYGFKSNRYLEYISIEGDSSDNIKGVKGVGEKTATRIILENENVLEYKDFNEKERMIVKDNMKLLKMNCSLNINYCFKKIDKDKLKMSSNEILKELKLHK